jgi:hypothetical protein
MWWMMKTDFEDMQRIEQAIDCCKAIKDMMKKGHGVLKKSGLF